MKAHTDYSIEPGVFPAELLQEERWFVWAMDEGRKIPRAPWHNDHTDKWESWKNTEMWADFDTADEWVRKVGRYEHASCIPAYESNETPRLILFDFDDCRDPETDAIHPEAWKFIETYGLHAALSTSGTGIHGYGWASIPDGYKPSFTIDLEPWEYHDEPELEVYGNARFLALTGEHIASTPVSVPDVDDVVGEMYRELGEERVTGHEREPERSRDELQNIEQTTDVQDVYDAISHTRPRDIRVRSSVTEERADGSKSLDPYWESSNSGTRLAEFEDHWLYRKGNHRLDALQLVALEDPSINFDEPGDYPSGETFANAVEALRDRGASIPKLVGTAGHTSAAAAAQSDAEPGEEEEAQADGGVAAASPSDDSGPPAPTLAERVNARILTPLEPPEDYEGEKIDQQVATDRFAAMLLDEYDFVRPRRDVRGWRDTLYVYVEEEGVYEPHGESFIEHEAERLLGAVATNQRCKEIVSKIERRSLVRPGKLTADPHRLVAKNGIVDLHTGELDPHTPEEYHRTGIDWEYHPNAECERIDEFFGEVVADTHVDTLYQLVAHCLYKEYLEEKAAMLLGDGQNGKSVFLNVLQEFLGEYNVSRRSLQDFSENDFAANNLQGKLANLHPDMAAQSVDELGVFKQLTGRDTLIADVKYERPIHFENHATLIFAANRMPKMAEDTHALWRRWIYVNFPYTFSNVKEDTKDPIPKRELMRELTDEDEMQGLLSRAVEELNRWHEGGELFTNVADPEQVREKMKRASEPVYNFAMTCLDEADDDEWVRKDEVRECYREFARQEGLPTIADNAFGERLLNIRDLAIESARRMEDDRRVRAYSGVEFSSRGRQILGLDESEADASLGQSGREERRNSYVEKVAEVTRDLETDDEKPTKGMILGRLSGSMSLSTAQTAFEGAKERGLIHTFDGDRFSVTD